MVDTAPCAIQGCEKPGGAGRGWCWMHYYRWRRHGDPQTVLKPQGDTEARFWVRVQKAAGCWLWTGDLNDRGYPTFALLHDRTVYAHRYAYELLVGPIPEGLTLDHLCRVPACVNPDHLEPVTKAENIRRAARTRHEERAS